MNVYLGYVFCVIGYVFYCMSRYGKDKKLMLTLDMCCKIFTIFSFYFLGSLSGAYSFFIGFFVLLLSNIKVRLDKRWYPLYFVFEGLYILILIWQYAGISSILVFITSSVTLICIWFLPPQKMRAVGIVNSCIYLSYQISIANWAGLLEILVIISNALSFIKYHSKTDCPVKG